MQTSRMIELINKLSNLKALVVGDIMLDRYILGSSDRVSDEAPVPIVRIKSSEERLGGAGNTVANLAGLGVQTTFAGIIGSDLEGNRVRELLESQDVNSEGLILDPSRTTIIKTRVLARSQQVLRIDWEDTSSINATIENQLIEYVKSKVHEFDLVVISDYGKGCLTPKFFEMINDFKGAGTFSMNKRPVVIDPSPVNYNYYKGFSVAKPNRREAEKATGVNISSIADAQKVAKLLQEKWVTDIILLSLSEDGLVVSSKDSSFSMPTKAAQVYDVSGAGDTVTAVFSGILASGGSMEEAAYLANVAAGIVIQEVGTVPINKDKLYSQLSLSAH